MKRLPWWLTIAALAVSLQCCHKKTVAVPADEVAGAGTITQVGVEGGFFGIAGDDGQNYDPVNLPEDFKVDGLKVEFRLKKTDQASFHMWGIVVEVVKIEKSR